MRVSGAIGCAGGNCSREDGAPSSADAVAAFKPVSTAGRNASAAAAGGLPAADCGAAAEGAAVAACASGAAGIGGGAGNGAAASASDVQPTARASSRMSKARMNRDGGGEMPEQ